MCVCVCVCVCILFYVTYVWFFSVLRPVAHRTQHGEKPDLPHGTRDDNLHTIR